MESALYVGRLRHRRFSPRVHEFSYPVYMAFLDVDELPELMGVSRFSSYNRWNWTAFYERDHFGDSRKPLRARLEEDAARHGVTLPDGRIFLLTHLRYLGYVFNPVSFFYCYARSGRLALMLAEVNNTFGESHNYWLTAENQRNSVAAMRYRTAKAMHVSPFMSMKLDYDWIFTPPGERLVAHMNTVQNGKAFFDATLRLERRPWESREIQRALISYPLMTARVIAAIHWEALRLWLKGVPVFTHRPKTAHQRDGEPGGAKVSGVEENLA
jgi:DUF1365 family protein